MNRRRLLLSRPMAYVLGSAMSLTVASGLGRGVFRSIDDVGFDWHLRHAGAVPADPRILLIDIDDGSLRTVGDWPWPRRRFAQLVNALHDLGAESIVLDIVFAEPSARRMEDLGVASADGAHPEKTGDLEVGANWIYDDEELRDAIRRAGNVYLAMYFESFPHGLSPRRVWDAAVDLVRKHPEIEGSDLGADLRVQFPALRDAKLAERLGLQHAALRARLLRLLLEEYGQTLAGAAEHLHAAVDEVEREWAWAKRAAADRLAEAFLAERPEGGLPAFVRSVLPDQPVDRTSPDGNTLRIAYRAGRARRIVTEGLPALPPSGAAFVVEAGLVTPPLDTLAEAARGVGFVSYPREQSGGVVRDLPLLSAYRGGLMLQLGLLSSTQSLGIPPESIEVLRNRFTLADSPAPRSFAIGRDGTTPIAWHVPATSWDWRDSYVHVPAARVLEIPLNQQAMANNDAQLGLRRAELVRLRHADTPSDYAAYVGLVNERIRLSAGPNGAATGPNDQVIDLDDAIGRIEAEALLWLERVHGLWQVETPQDAAEEAMRADILALHRDLGEGRLVTELAELNRRLAARNRELIEELRALVEGHVCLVGYTASGVADVITSPAFKSVPGVMAHANVVNMVLQNHPILRASGAMNALWGLLVGLGITWWSARRSPLASVSGLMVACGAVFAAGAWVFHARGYHLATVPIALGGTAVWACVAVFRQFTEERERRAFQRALSQYTSPAVASRISQRAAADDLAPRGAVVTCFFSDLQGFTPLSEQLGASRTRALLNPYLEQMSRVLVEHQAIINKFIGDGIFAFFNAPILACADHARMACRCALAAQRALGELNASRSAEDLPPLSMRIGLSTGEVFIGDYGSDNKLDYTCIGDTVNVGARLEAANKSLGTAVLVDRATREAAGAEFAFRYVGRLLLPGKVQPVESFELRGLTDDRPSSDGAFVEQFEQAVLHYQSCAWELCHEAMLGCARQDPADGATSLYLRAVTSVKDQSHEEWSGALFV